MDSSPNIVYYNGFWYSGFLPIGKTVNELILGEKNQFEKLKKDLRLLSLIFDVIHIPRSHLLTFHTNTNWSIVRKYILDYDFQVLVSNRIILSSALPYIDEYSDTERIIERVKSKKWSKNLDDNLISIIKELSSVNIDSDRESRNNVDEFQQYITLLKSKNGKIGRELDEIKKRSNFGNTPFLHEMFVEELYKSQKIDSSSKESIWRFTNSLYMTTGCLELGSNRRINLEKSVEDKAAKYDNTGLLRGLYSSKFIEALISEELGDKYLIKFLNAPLDKVLHFRELKSWNIFKSDIFEMFETLTQIEKIRPEEFAAFKGQEKILAYKKYILGSDKDKFSSLMAGLLETAAGVYDPALGKVVKTSKSVIAGILVKKYSNWKISKTIKGYNEFWKEFKSVLDEI